MARPPDKERYEQLKRSIADIGLIRRGSLVKRFMPCGTPGCRCQNDPPELHGPYYQWSRKVRGKTATARLTPEQAELMQEWIANGRHLSKIIAEIEKVAYRITERELRKARS
jgi:hypothetical protein